MNKRPRASATRVRHSIPRPRMAVAVAIAALMSTGCGVFRGRETPSAYVDDAAVTARVKTALIKSPGMKASEIDVHTYRGVVTLDGVVDSQEMLRNAETITHNTAGVSSVRSTLQVARTEPLAERR
jgi:hyperosmotically inducible periplasmic protein